MKTASSTVIVILALCLSFFAGRFTVKNDVITTVDTLVIRDTVREVHPVEVVRYVDRVIRDTTLVVRVDTVTNTRFVEVPIERKRYTTPAYDVLIEGYKPSLLSIDVYTETKFIDRVDVQKRKTRWGVGVQAGCGVTTDGAIRPYIGVGVSYNIFTW